MRRRDVLKAIALAPLAPLAPLPALGAGAAPAGKRPETLSEVQTAIRMWHFAGLTAAAVGASEVRFLFSFYGRRAIGFTGRCPPHVRPGPDSITYFHAKCNVLYDDSGIPACHAGQPIYFDHSRAPELYEVQYSCGLDTDVTIQKAVCTADPELALVVWITHGGIDAMYRFPVAYHVTVADMEREIARMPPSERFAGVLVRPAAELGESP